jgi:hypothetical protein
LRNYAAPEFALANGPTRLAGLFKDVRAKRLDLLPVMFTDPAIVDSLFS